MARTSDLLKILESDLRKKLWACGLKHKKVIDGIDAQTVAYKAEIEDVIRMALDTIARKYRAKVKGRVSIRFAEVDDYCRSLSFWIEPDAKNPVVRKIQAKKEKAQKAKREEEGRINAEASEIRRQIMLHGADADLVALVEAFAKS